MEIQRIKDTRTATLVIHEAILSEIIEKYSGNPLPETGQADAIKYAESCLQYEKAHTGEIFDQDGRDQCETEIPKWTEAITSAKANRWQILKRVLQEAAKPMMREKPNDEFHQMGQALNNLALSLP